MDGGLLHSTCSRPDIQTEGGGLVVGGDEDGQETGDPEKAQDPGGGGVADRRHQTDLLVQLQSRFQATCDRILVRVVQALVSSRLPRAVGDERTPGQRRQRCLPSQSDA